MPEDSVSAHSDIIIAKLTVHDDYAKCQTLMCFFDFRKEDRSRLIINNALKNGKHVLDPMIIKDSNCMIKNLYISRTP